MLAEVLNSPRKKGFPAPVWASVMYFVTSDWVAATDRFAQPSVG